MSKMDKRRLHHYYRRMRPIRPRYLLLLALVFLGLAVFGLRQNNLRMVELRNEVITADRRGGDIETPLKDLRDYVYSHMNTDLSGGPSAINPPIQLKGRYERLIAAQEKTTGKTNEAVKSHGEALCAARYPGEGYNSPRVACVQRYVQQNAAETGDIPEDLYKFDFVSPKWTPDFAGLTLVLGLFFLALFVLRAALGRWAKSKL